MSKYILTESELQELLQYVPDTAKKDFPDYEEYESKSIKKENIIYHIGFLGSLTVMSVAKLLGFEKLVTVSKWWMILSLITVGFMYVCGIAIKVTEND